MQSNWPIHSGSFLVFWVVHLSLEWSHNLAHVNAVWPKLSIGSVLAPASSRIFTVSQWPLIEASISGVCPSDTYEQMNRWTLNSRAQMAVCGRKQVLISLVSSPGDLCLLFSSWATLRNRHDYGDKSNIGLSIWTRQSVPDHNPLCPIALWHLWSPASTPLCSLSWHGIRCLAGAAKK